MVINNLANTIANYFNKVNEVDEIEKVNEMDKIDEINRMDEINEIDEITESKVNNVETWLLVSFLLMSRVLSII